MKPHEFREEVNKLKELVDKYAGTAQLRSRLSMFLFEFEGKCE